jgi:HAD superfamily hydrolase (TIGR01490 family)
MAGAAFFDLDKTLIEGSSAFYFARASYRAGLLDRRQLLRGAVANLRFRLVGSSDEENHAVRDRVLEAIAGVRVRDLQRLGPELLAHLLPRVYQEMLDEAYAHQDAGRPAIIVTATSQELADLMAHVLVFDGGIGTRAEIRDGVYTGRLAGPFTYGEGKAEAIRAMAAERGLDLAESYAYSDSVSDLPMLRAVGHPVAVNPDPELARIARAEGWRVMRFDRLRRRLRIAAALGGVAAAAGTTGYVAGELRPRLARRARRRRLPLPR